VFHVKANRIIRRTEAPDTDSRKPHVAFRCLDELSENHVIWSSVEQHGRRMQRYLFATRHLVQSGTTTTLATTTQRSENGAITLSRMNFLGNVRHGTTFS